MRHFGGTVALICGILGFFAPFVEAFFSTMARPSMSALDPLVLAIGMFTALIVVALALAILNRRGRAWAVLLILFCLLAMLGPSGSLVRTLLWIEIAAATLTLFDRTRYTFY